MTNRYLKKQIEKIKKWAEKIRLLTDAELQEKTPEFKERLAGGESLTSIMPEAYAVICEVEQRILGKYPYDVQIMGAVAMHRGDLVEMNTGEGKTLTATMPLYLHALTGESTMLVTSNEYLAIRDSDEMRPVYEFLGMTVAAGASGEGMEEYDRDDKRLAYAADIHYTTHSILGFDWLINNLVQSAEERFMRDFGYVIIDEADLVLLDAAQTPLVISGSPRVQSNLYELADFFVSTLEEDKHYEEEEKSVWLTDEGVRYAEKFFGIEHYYANENFEINRHVTLALRAHVLFEKGEEYLVSEKGTIDLIDNGSGRSLANTKLRGGQHQALEAKEKVKITNETRSLALVTFQNLFMLFPEFSGMSGTISDAKHELWKIYKKKTVVIPPHKPVIRRDMPDRYFKTSEEQYSAALEKVEKSHAVGQPVLIITSTIADTELASRILFERSIPHSVLNANNAFWEAEMIKEAGQKNAVTVATGIAGRGTDIKLGEGVKELGGLAVIGIGRMENVRQERQARGRSGRQGDPGYSRFYVSLEDDVVANSIGEKKLKKYVEDDKWISKRRLKHLIDSSQNLGEESAVAGRENSVRYDKIIRRQRGILYEARNNLLDGSTLDASVIKKMLRENIKAFVKAGHTSVHDVNRYILDNISYGLDVFGSDRSFQNKSELASALTEYAEQALEGKMSEFESDDIRGEFVRLCVLHSVDQAWVEEVDYVQQLQAAVSGRSYAQRDTFNEYSNEAYFAFNTMKDNIRRDICRNIMLGEASFDKDGCMHISFP